MRRLAFFFLLAVLLLPGKPVLARSYTVSDLQITAEVLSDGSLRVVEHRTFRFRGRFHGFTQWINKVPGFDIVEVAVEEGGNPYRFNPGSAIGPAGTYYLVSEADRLLVDWSFDAADTERTFTLRYRVMGAIKVHEDTAELYFQFVGDDWEVKTDKVQVQLILPAGVQREEIMAFGHGPANGVVSIDSGQLVKWEAAPLPAWTFLEGRVLFPASLLPLAEHRTGLTALDVILTEEKSFARNANRQRLLARVQVGFGLLVLLLGLAFGLWLYRRYGREFRPEFDGEYYRELPAAYTPAELGQLWRFSRTGPEDLTATLVDLARKGFLRLEELVTEVRGLPSKRKTDYRIIRTDKEGGLESHEQRLLDFLFGEVAFSGKELTFSALEEFSRRNRTAFSRFWHHWQRGLKKRGEELGFFDRESGRVQKMAVMLAAAILFVSFGFLYMGLVVAGSGMLLAAAVIGAFSIFLSRRSHQGALDFARWRAFRRFLLHFSQMERHQLPSLVIWEHYLVYAITLGVAKEVMKQLSLVYPELREESHSFGRGWYVRGSTGGTARGDGLLSLTDSFRKTITAATSPQSSGSGKGGGFSRGGGGGFGGGGGRAR